MCSSWSWARIRVSSAFLALGEAPAELDPSRGAGLTLPDPEVLSMMFSRTTGGKSASGKTSPERTNQLFRVSSTLTWSHSRYKTTYTVTAPDITSHNPSITSTVLEILCNNFETARITCTLSVQVPAYEKSYIRSGRINFIFYFLKIISKRLPNS